MPRRPQAQHLEDSELEQRREFAQRQRELERQTQELVGAWTFWREKLIVPKYGLRDGDWIEDDGRIVRAAAAQPKEP